MTCTGKRWFRIVPCESIPAREGRLVEIAQRQIAIFNLGDSFLAVENRCPHRGGPLSDGDRFWVDARYTQLRLDPARKAETDRMAAALRMQQEGAH